jgi:hypothetical protein
MRHSVTEALAGRDFGYAIPEIDGFDNQRMSFCTTEVPRINALSANQRWGPGPRIPP